MFNIVYNPYMEFNLKNETEILTVIKYIKEKTDFTRKDLVIALVGDLGTGKTTFTKYLAKELGVVESVISPTFIIHREYTIPNTTRMLHHLDLYRLQGETELNEIKVNELAKNNIVIIEWADKFESYINKIKDTAIIWIYFEHESETERKLTIK